MKLSQVIEQMLVNRVYAYGEHHYMCNALKEHGFRDAVDAVQDMVATIHGESYRGTPLICAVHEAGIANMKTMSCREHFDFTAQLYCWWVFDLKRKGL